MAKPKPRVKVPKKANKGEIFEIKTLISHTMESGQRKNKDGALIPRMIIHTFKAEFNGETVFHADWHGAISANPYMSFYAMAEESGEFTFTWIDEANETFVKTAKISVI